MTIYQTVNTTEQENNNNNNSDADQQRVFDKPKSRSFIGSIMLVICIISFVLQTELSQYVQRTTNYSKPYFILYLSHSCYMIIIPFQLLIEYFKTPSPSHFHYKDRLKQAIDDWKRTVQISISELPDTYDSSILQRTALKLAILLCIPSYLWYLSVNLTSAANLTAIYNTNCLFAYIFSIVMLHDSIVAAKIGAVVLCIVGVVTMAFWPVNSNNSNDPSLMTTMTPETNAVFGVVTATIGAASVGYYEVYYKKYASPKQPTVLFANTLSGGIGVATFFVLWIPIPLLHWFGIESFSWPDLNTFLSILAIASASMIYNATCMAIVALVNPVFAAVGVMLTIPAVAVTDVVVTGKMVPASTVVGSLFILVGFVILNRRVYQEEKEMEENEERQHNV